MAITKITAPSSIPATVADYQAQNSHLMAFINQINSQAFILSDPNGTTAPTIKQGAYISHGGSLYIVDTADATISGTPSDGTVYIRVSGTDTLTAEYVTDISSYAWNSAYNAMISGSYTLLPYMLIKSGTSWTKYRFEQHKQSLKSLNVADNITLGGTVDGHNIDSELDTLNSDVSTLNSRVNQDLKTTASPTFASLGITGAISGASINTGHGDNEVFKITNETLSFGYNNTSNVSVQVSAMEVGEIRFVNTIGTLAPGAVSTYYGNLKTPATVGTYFVIPVGQGELHPYTGVQAYNVSLWSIYNGSEYTINLESSLLIRRIT